MRTKPILLLTLILFPFSVLLAQHWTSSNIFAGYAVNAVDILSPGYIVTGGGKQSPDSVQIMFTSTDYGTTWNENPNDGYASWNKSIAFADTLHGLGAGYQGRIISTSDGGITWGNPVFPINRNFNKIVNVSPLVYYSVGGINDSIQTIIKTSNGGTSWSVMRDTSGPGFNSAFFISPMVGFVVGDSGMILTTADGGNTWSRITSPVQRNFDGIAFINADTGYIAGGLSGTNATRTILQTVNAGVTWTILEDQPGSMLHAISFVNSTNGYIVGDSAAFLQSNNGGQTWTTGNVSGSTTGEQFTSVKFYSPNFGVVGAFDGFVYVYTNVAAPVIQNEQIIFGSGDSLSLSAQVNTYQQSDNISFIYSTSPDLSNPTATNPAAINSNNPQTIITDITSLLSAPGTYYFACFVNTLDSTYSGDTLSFTIPAYLPQLTTLPGSGTTSNSITLRGQVSNLLQPANLYFEYQNTYDTSVITVAATPGLIIDTLYHSALADIAGLLPYTPYQVRLKATSGHSVMYGNYIQFSTTPGITVVSTLPATGITASSATLQGQVGYLPFTASVSFQYSLLGSSIMQSVTATPSSISDTGFYFPYALISGLAPNSYYQYRLEVTDLAHTIYGNYNYFYNGSPEIVVADSATSVTYNSATLNGHVSNIHFPANMYFYYSPANSAANSVLASPAFISDTLTHTLTVGLGGLQPYTLYNYSLYAIDAPLVIQSANPASFYTGPGYHPSLILNTEPATHVTSDSAIINAIGANIPDTALVFFDYWQSGNTPVSIAATPGSITDSLVHQISVPITGLTANTLYLYRVKIVLPGGTIYGDSLSFFYGPNTIPNFDFENWTTTSGAKPAGWYNVFGPAVQVNGANGSSYAVKLQSTGIGIGALLNGLPLNTSGGNLVNILSSLSGGFAYNARPDTLRGMFEYNILSGDTAYVIIELKSAGSIVARQFMPVYGNSGTGFQLLQFKVNYTAPGMPDTLILGFIPTDIYANFPQYGSSMTVDNLTFGSSYPPIPNGNFDSWAPFTFNKLANWTYMDMLDFGLYTNPDSQCLNQDTAAWHGNYAIDLSSIIASGVMLKNSAIVTTDPYPNEGPQQQGPDFPLNHTPALLTGYYKFFPQSNDTLSIYCFFYKNGVRVGYATFQTDQPATEYTFFAAHCLNYPGVNAIPDSARIQIWVPSDIGTSARRAVIDYLAFDGYTPATDTITLNIVPTSIPSSLNIYPNPANDHFTVEYTSQSGDIDYLKIYDICGKELYETEINSAPGEVTREIDLSEFAEGMYLVSIQSGTSIATQKFVIQR